MVDKKTSVIAVLCVTTVLFLGLWINADQEDRMLREDRIQLLHQIEDLEAALNSQETEIETLQSQISDMTDLIEGLDDKVKILENEKSRLEEELKVEETTLNLLQKSCELGGFNVTLLGSKWAESLDGYDPERSGGRFLLVTLSVENIGKSSRLFGVAGEYFGATGSAEVMVIDSEGFE